MSCNEYFEARRRGLISGSSYYGHISPKYIPKSSASGNTVAAAPPSTVTDTQSEDKMEKNTSDTHSKGQPEERYDDADDHDDADNASATWSSASVASTRCPSVMSFSSTISSAETSSTIDAQTREAAVPQTDLTDHALLQDIHSQITALRREVAENRREQAEIQRQQAAIGRRMVGINRHLAEMDGRLANVEQEHAEMDLRLANLERQNGWTPPRYPEPLGRVQEAPPERLRF
ncbi:hypothetical protein LTR10_019383 [Elasticomyces elasticus]|uniref:Uncharacterized protein n=1 Tax=Exophiala sideris TaxID=1016849 RepID=A0ABR0IVD4_9EURO|nr:hypothetical protein LTR10_019383 [Elasticomyces elasticus]KAK5021424.1 hypothetical protein LTS07_011034 [Exophiala sideris]KAK5025422.1 hypothetical protein LTR13_010499 [Exophiala sideris]KAK5049273.1 hypothetical protein LTR69_011058 [Exophiala sideris]KAK5176946.1 hypothetical protein LTR44_010519 [Eurotiomycetes sp. CCFEE 6388]